MELKLNSKVLITTNNWFTAPDGNTYKAVFGTVKATHSDKETLGITTNDKSTNWYLEVGNMIIAGCQIHYVIRTNEVSLKPTIREIEYEGHLHIHSESISRIYHADDDLDV